MATVPVQGTGGSRERIFVSYASEDATLADRVRTGLEQGGVPCWIAPRDIEPGTSFPAAITAAIQSSAALVVLLTAESNASRHVLSEVELAFNAGKPILAVLVGKVEPSADLKYFISTTHWFDAESSFDDADLEKLKADLEKLRTGERLRLGADRTRTRRRRAMFAAAATASLIVLAVIGYSMRQSPPVSPAPSGTNPPAPEASPSTPGPATSLATPAPGPAPESPRAEPPVSPPVAATPAARMKVNAADSQTYVWIPPGSFAMGCSRGDGDCQPDELPVHSVRIRRGFWLARTEVTNAQYEKRMTGTERAEGATGAHPVVGMSRLEAKAYCAKVDGRLPTEAEWEYAARGGSGDRYYGTLSSIAWYEANSDDHSHPVGQKAANAYGLQDMLGNVYEWVLDRYYNKYDDTTDEVEEPLPANSSAVTRGGAWHSEARNVRVSNREDAPRDYADGDTGFRCALIAP